MSVLLAWILCPIIFGITFLIQTGFFIYKLITSQHVEFTGNRTVRTISLTSGEIVCCVGFLWNTCLDKTTNRMALSTFIIWYIVGICVNLLLASLLFCLILYGYHAYV